MPSCTTPISILASRNSRTSWPIVRCWTATVLCGSDGQSETREYLSKPDTNRKVPRLIEALNKVYDRRLSALLSPRDAGSDRNRCIADIESVYRVVSIWRIA